MGKKDTLLQILQNIGLSEKEAMIYLELLELHEALPSAISRKADTKRSTTYLILEQLQKKGLVSHVKKSGHLYFRALDPKAFLDQKRNQYKELGASVDNLEEILPELQNLHSDFVVTPQMSVFKGKEGLIQIMEDTLTTSTELLCWANIILATNTVLKDYYPTYIRKKVEKQIPLRGIFCHDKEALRFKKRGGKEIRDIYTIPKNKFPFENEINIYDDKVAIISHKDAVGVIIQNKAIANTQRAIFNFAFEYAKSIESEMLSTKDLEYLKSPHIENGVFLHKKSCICPSPNSTCLQ
jgi:HTH-type transcriptional regulator, sugar sensing transcriptional regulator